MASERSCVACKHHPKDGRSSLCLVCEDSKARCPACEDRDALLPQPDVGRGSAGEKANPASVVKRHGAKMSWGCEVCNGKGYVVVVGKRGYTAI